MFCVSIADVANDTTETGEYSDDTAIEDDAGIEPVELIIGEGLTDAIESTVPVNLRSSERYLL